MEGDRGVQHFHSRAVRTSYYTVRVCRVSCPWHPGRLIKGSRNTCGKTYRLRRGTRRAGKCETRSASSAPARGRFLRTKTGLPVEYARSAAGSWECGTTVMYGGMRTIRRRWVACSVRGYLCPVLDVTASVTDARRPTWTHTSSSISYNTRVLPTFRMNYLLPRPSAQDLSRHTAAMMLHCRRYGHSVPTRWTVWIEY